MTSEEMAKLNNLLTPVVVLLDELHTRTALHETYEEDVVVARKGLVQAVALIRAAQKREVEER